MNTDLSALLTAISPENLAVARNSSRAKYPGGRSPYKPLLLLAVFGSVNQGRPNYYKGWFRPSDAVGSFAYLHCSIFPNEDNSPKVVSSRFAQPYWYLGTGKPRLWDLRPRRGREKELQLSIAEKIQIKTFRKLEQLVEYAKLDTPTLNLLNDNKHYSTIESYLIDNFFNADRAISKIINTLP